MKLHGIPDSGLRRVAQWQQPMVYQNDDDSIHVEVRRRYNEDDRVESWEAAVYERDTQSMVEWRGTHEDDEWPYLKDLMAMLEEKYGSLEPMYFVSNVFHGWADW